MLHYAFMLHAILAGGIVAILCGLVGWFLLLRAEAFASHALAHVGFTGATGAVLLGLDPLIGLVAATLAAGIGMGWLGGRLANRDVAIGMVLAMALALGLLFLHFYTGFAAQATALLFGNVLAVRLRAVLGLAGLAVICLGGLLVLARRLIFSAIHPELAAAEGVEPKRLGTLFLMIVALATAGAAEITGVLMVFTLMIGPAAAAQRALPRLWPSLALAPLLALVETWAGLSAAYYTGWPTSFWIAFISFVVFLAAPFVQSTDR